MENKSYKRFEDMEVWQDAKDIAIEIYKVTSLFDPRKDFSFIDQLRRSALSISSNIAEGYERSSKKELRQYLNIAKGSAGELRSQLLIAKEIGKVNDQSSKDLICKCENVSRQLKGFMRFLEKKA